MLKLTIIGEEEKDMDDLVTIINSVGFPIFACVYMMRNNEKLANAITELKVTLESIKSKIGDDE